MIKKFKYRLPPSKRERVLEAAIRAQTVVRKVFTMRLSDFQMLIPV